MLFVVLPPKFSTLTIPSTYGRYVGLANGIYHDANLVIRNRAKRGEKEDWEVLFHQWEGAEEESFFSDNPKAIWIATIEVTPLLGENSYRGTVAEYRIISKDPEYTYASFFRLLPNSWLFLRSGAVYYNNNGELISAEPEKALIPHIINTGYTMIYGK